jgi:hypothetical protein
MQFGRAQVSIIAVISHCWACDADGFQVELLVMYTLI